MLGNSLENAKPGVQLKYVTQAARLSSGIPAAQKCLVYTALQENFYALLGSIWGIVENSD